MKNIVTSIMLSGLTAATLVTATPIKLPLSDPIENNIVTITHEEPKGPFSVNKPIESDPRNTHVKPDSLYTRSSSSSGDGYREKFKALGEKMMAAKSPEEYKKYEDEFLKLREQKKKEDHENGDGHEISLCDLTEPFCL